jgi:glycine cleavage system H protein
VPSLYVKNNTFYKETIAMKTPANLKYTKTDEWVLVSNNVATIGVTDYAQSQLSDVVYVDIIPSVDDTIEVGSPSVTIESVKAAAEVNTPLSGKVLEINTEIGSAPQTVNEDPYGGAWMLKIEMTKPGELKELMDAEAYNTYCNTRGH